MNSEVYLVPNLGQSETDDDPDPSKAEPIVDQLSDLDAALSFRKEEVLTRVAKNFFFDMKLAGEPLQCKETDGTCDELEWVSSLTSLHVSLTLGRREIRWVPYQRADSLNRHKFLLDIDGNGWR